MVKRVGGVVANRPEELVSAPPAPVPADPPATGDHTSGADAKLLLPRPPVSGTQALALLEKAASGACDAEQALLSLANHHGLPLLLGTTALFVRVADGEGVTSVAGDHNDWRPVPMKRKGKLEVLEVPVERLGKYRFVDPNGSYASDPLSRAYAHDERGEVSLARAHGAHLERFFALSAPGLKPRTVRVWVPRRKPTHHLYMHDGQNLFDPGASHGSWKAQQAAGPSTLLVGIDTTDQRFSELTFCEDFVLGEVRGGGADRYADFIEQVVRPLIEAHYGPAKRRGILGSSLGGLMACHQAQRYPGTFDFVGAMSARFDWGRIGNPEGDSFFARYAQMRPGREVFYLDSGGGPDGSDCYSLVRRFADQLAANDFRFGETLHHWYEPQAPHSEAAWAARLFRPMAIFEKL